MQQVDIEKIRSNLSEKHDKFIDELGTHSDRVLAEHNLIMELTFTRIKFICESFVELKIVDESKVSKGNGLRIICLQKSGYDNFVNISTNGEKLKINGVSSQTSFKASGVEATTLSYMSDGVVMGDVSKDDFDWVDFSDKLLAEIHSSIYERKEALDTKIWGTCTVPSDGK